VNHRGLRAFSFAGAALALALVGSACNSAQPTAINVVQTPTPTAATQATDTPTPTPEATPVATPSAAPTASAVPTATPAASATVAPSAGPTSAAAFCTGTANNQPVFVTTAKMLKGAVYCATLGKGWSVTKVPGWTYDATKSPGWMKVKYQAGSATIELDEGAFCLTPTVCSPLGGSIGTANFGNITGGTLFQTAATDFSIYVSPGTKNAYDILGHNVSQANLVSIAAALKVIPKS